MMRRVFLALVAFAVTGCRALLASAPSGGELRSFSGAFVSTATPAARAATARTAPLMAAGGNTRKKKKKVAPASFPKPGAAGAAAAAAPTARKAKWLLAIAAADATALADGGSKVAEVDGATRLLVKRGGGERGFSGLDVACGRCSYPLLNGDVVDSDRITCAACGETFDLASGEPRGKVETGGNFLRGVVGTLTNSKTVKPVPTFAVRVAESGDVFLDANSGQ